MGHVAHLRKLFKSINTYNYNITLIKRRKKTLSTFWEFESPSPMDALCQILLKLSEWFWIRRFLNFVNVLLFRNYLSLEKGGALHLQKLEFPLIKNALCQILLKLSEWFWIRKFLNFVNVFTISKWSQLGKGRSPSFAETWISFDQGCFVLRLVKIGPVVLKKKIF